MIKLSYKYTFLKFDNFYFSILNILASFKNLFTKQIPNNLYTFTKDIFIEKLLYFIFNPEKIWNVI